MIVQLELDLVTDMTHMTHTNSTQICLATDDYSLVQTCYQQLVSLSLDTDLANEHFFVRLCLLHAHNMWINANNISLHEILLYMV